MQIERTWMGASLIAGGLLLASCSSSGTSEERHSEETPAASSASPSLDLDQSRWGYNPGLSTGERDPPLSFAPLPPGYRIETFVTGLQRPTALAFLPDGRLLVAEQAGAVQLVEADRLQPEPFATLDVYFPDVSDRIIELGLVGLTVGPDDGAVYVYYTSDDPERRTVLARLRDDGEVDELFSLDAAPECCHIGGSLRFAPDGTLLVTVGDHQMLEEAQDRGSPFGGVLRVNVDGSPALGNPFEDDPQADARLYAYGLRNPFDVTIEPESGRIFATENGFQGQDAIVEIKPGANYGWPGFDLAVPVEEIEPPLLFYHEAIGPAGIEMYVADALPALSGKLLFCQFHNGGALHAISFRPDGTVEDDVIVALGCTSDVLTGPDGFIYFLDYVGGTVYRIARDMEVAP